MPRKARSMSSSGGGSSSTPANTNAPGKRRQQQFERQTSAGQIRLRSGSAGHRELKNEEPELEDEEHEPIEVLAHTYMHKYIFLIN